MSDCALSLTAGPAREHDFDALRSYETRPVNVHRLAALREHAGRTVLDVGCGNGSYAPLLEPQRAVIGLDSSTFPTWKIGRFVVGDAMLLPFGDASVDTIAAFETLEHLPRPQAALAEYYRVCRRNLVLTVPNCDLSSGLRRSNLIYGHWQDPTHVNFFTLSTVTAALEQAGFRVTVSRLINTIDPWPFITEFLRLPPIAAKVLRRLLGWWTRPYSMTCLVVGEKGVSADTGRTP